MCLCGAHCVCQVHGVHVGCLLHILPVQLVKSTVFEHVQWPSGWMQCATAFPHGHL